MAETESSSSSTAIVALVAIAVLALLVWFFVFRSGPAPAADGPDLEVNVENPLPDGE